MNTELGEGIELRGNPIALVCDGRPVGGKDIVGLATQKEGICGPEPFDHDTAHVIVEERHQPAGLLEASGFIFVGLQAPA
jgi:hypothetical protein